MPTLFKSLAELLEKIENTRKRLEITALTADFLKTLAPEEVEPAVSMILGRPFTKWNPKTLDVSWTTLTAILQTVTGAGWNAFAEAFRDTGDIGSATKSVFEQTKLKKQAQLLEKELTVPEVRRMLEAIAETTGSGSREKKERLITALLSQASPVEAKYLVKIFTGEMRTGLHEGLMEQAVAKAFEVPLATVQKASMAMGDIGEVAAIAKEGGKDALTNISFRLFRPVKLMLAQTAADVAEALEEQGGKTAFEYKYDGARVQIHKQGGEVRIFSRRLTDVTQSLPEIGEVVKANVKATDAILEGEVIAVDAAGSPVPFQHLMRRFKRVHEVTGMAEKIPVRLFLFDVLYLDGKSLITAPYLQRRQILGENAGDIPLTTQIVTDDRDEAERFLQRAIDAGHEGLMAKKLNSPYTPGTRGKRWLKIKPVLEPLDLVIVAAEYGHGRRHGWLSDYYLAARDAETGEFQTVGKTFKGLTDAEIVEMTKLLKAIAVSEEGNRVIVLPKIVVEVAYNEIQKSPKYHSRMALRFARITRIRYDKDAEGASTLERVRMTYEQQFAKKGRYKAE
ncbi:ATP-dependent DNA ligase [Candidatus Bathyarchaeota archaeon A05DMB-2]|jgi:DNA ligase-1|nr:ATP-dependent DNA ligase [Candidatus Bathyarchaeota archaeon A05DMB-2]